MRGRQGRAGRFLRRRSRAARRSAGRACALPRAPRRCSSSRRWSRWRSRRRPACACAISWRRKIRSLPTSLAMAVMFAGSCDSEMAGIGRIAVRAARHSRCAQSLASVADPPLPNRISLPPRRSRSSMAADRVGDRLRLRSAATSSRRRSTSPALATIDRATSLDERLAVRDRRGRETDRGSPAGPASRPSSRCSKKTCTVSHSV